MANRIVLNTISYHGKGAIENIVPELISRGYQKAFICSDPDLIKFGVTKKLPISWILPVLRIKYTAISNRIPPSKTYSMV